MVFKLNMSIHFSIVTNLSNKIYFEFWCNKQTKDYECITTT